MHGHSMVDDGNLVDRLRTQRFARAGDSLQDTSEFAAGPGFWSGAAPPRNDFLTGSRFVTSEDATGLAGPS